MRVPQVLGHAHDYAPWLLHVVNHLLGERVAHVRVDLAVERVEELEEGFDKRRHLLLILLVVAQKHNFLLQEHAAVELDKVVYVHHFQQLVEVEIALEEEVLACEEDRVHLEERSLQ